MMQVVKLLALCTLPYVGALDIFIDGPVLLLDCRSDSGQHMAESTTTSVSTEAPVDPKELFDAARDGDLSFINTAISQLSSSGLDLNWRNTDHDGYTALHIAAKEDQPIIVAALLDAGADPNVRVQNDYGGTPMHIAARYNSISVLRVLLDHKYQADVNLQDNNGWTPIYIAAESGLTGSLELLLAHGGDPNKVGTDGISPLMRASWWGHVEAVRMLIQAGAHVDHARHRDGRTALHLAAVGREADVVLLLLQNGADKNKQDSNGNTAADAARNNDNDSVAQLIDNY